MPPATAQRQAPGRRQSIAAIPFTAAAHLHTEQAFIHSYAAVTDAQQDAASVDIPAFGFLRHLLLEVTFSGATIGAGALGADWPWSILQRVQLLDTNGAPIFGPVDGYALYLANKYGAYSFKSDPKLDVNYDGTINGKFFLRIPIEITRHNAYGAIANQNAANSYKFQYSIGTRAQAFGTNPTTAPAVSVRGHLEAWSQPAATDLAGRPQQREPVGHGTTQFWSTTSKGVNAGANNVLFGRVGNLIRNWVIVARTAAGVRSDTVFPDPFTIQHDARNMTTETQAARIKLQEETQNAGSTRETGVFVFPFNTLVMGKSGDEEPNLWLPTVQASRIELQGSSVAAGTLQIITNDIAAVEIDPADRYVETSETGFHPALGQPVPAGTA